MILESSIQIPFSYAAGDVGSRYLIALRDDMQLLASRCAACERVACPPRSFCTACAEKTSELVGVGPEGRLISWTDRPGRGLFGLIILDGATTAMLHRLDIPAEMLGVDLRVRARFAEERSASPGDLEGFELV